MREVRGYEQRSGQAGIENALDRFAALDRGSAPNKERAGQNGE